jgi:phage shock protein C
MNEPESPLRDPAAAAGIGTDPADAAQSPPPPPPGEPPRSRRFYRSRDEMIGGVAAGIAEYFDIDPVIPRIVFVLLAIFGNGTGLILYIVLWVVVPQRPVGSDVPGVAGVGTEGRGATSGSAVGAIVIGVLLVAIGIAWLLTALDIADLTEVRWDLALPIALIATGAVLAVFAAAGRRGGGGLITLGVILTIAVVVSSPFRVGIGGAFGDQVEAPNTAGELEDEYSHVFGSLSLDLSDVDIPTGRTTTEASVVFGSIEIQLPQDEDIGVRIEANAAFGSTQFPDGRESSGIAADRTYTSPNYEDATRQLDIDVSSVFGSAEIDR